MKRVLFVLSILLVYGCSLPSPVALEVNGNNQFEASYAKRSRIPSGDSTYEKITLLVKGKMFRVKYFKESKLLYEVIYNGKTLWYYFPSEDFFDAPYAVRRNISATFLSKKLFFWKMKATGLPEPEDIFFNDSPCHRYVFKEKEVGGFNNVELFVHREEFYVKRVKKKAFLNADPYNHYLTWGIECTAFKTKEDINEYLFFFEPPKGTKIVSKEELATASPDHSKTIISLEN